MSTNTSLPLPSLRGNTLARFLADAYVLVASLAAATITARLLGPAGKGFYSGLLLLAVLFVHVFGAGLGEAAVVMVGRGRATLRDAAPSTLCAVALLGALGALAFLLGADVAFHPDTSEERLAVLCGGVLVAANVYSQATMQLLVSLERLVVVAVMTVLLTTATTVALYLLLAAAGWGLPAAVLASVAGAAVLSVGFTLALRREGVPLRLRWAPGYLASAVRLGAAVQASNVLVIMSGRLDLLLVYRLSGEASAGTYSVALTVAALVGAVPMALSHATFPRLAALDDAEADALTRRLCRTATVAALAASAGLAVLAPVVVPAFFGDAYGAAVAPTVVLLPAGVLWSVQFVVCRAAAARAAPRALVVSFAASFATMVLFDLVLIEPFGGVGAALATLASAVVGVGFALGFARRAGWSPGALLPRPHDALELFADLLQVLRSLRPSR